MRALVTFAAKARKALRNALVAWLELRALVRLGEAALAVHYYEADIALSKRGLDKALRAYDRARADVLEHELRHAAKPAPTFLTKRAPVRRSYRIRGAA